MGLIPVERGAMASHRATRGRKERLEASGYGALWIWALAILVVAFLAAALFGQTRRSDAGEAGAEIPAGLSVSEVAGNPETYAGSLVTVAGDLEEVVSPNALRIGGGIAGGDGLLVIGLGDFPTRLGSAMEQEEAVLQVTGTVRMFDRVEFENESGIDLDDAVFAYYEGRPALVADRLAVYGPADGKGREEAVAAAPGRSEAGSGGAGVGMAPEGGTAGGAADPAWRDLEELSRVVRETEGYFGDTVTVEGYVALIVDSNAFSLSPTPGAADEAILVAGGAGVLPSLAAGSPVRVTGVVRPFDIREYEAELGLDLDDALFGPFDREPSIRAWSVQPVDDPTVLGPAERGRGGAEDRSGEADRR
jgi:hypothetical protein